MNKSSLQIFNAIAFPPSVAPARQPRAAREDLSPVAAALAQEFSRLALVLALTLAVALGLILAGTRSFAPADSAAFQPTGAQPTPAVAAASSPSPFHSTNR